MNYQKHHSSIAFSLKQSIGKSFKINTVFSLEISQKLLEFNNYLEILSIFILCNK